VAVFMGLWLTSLVGSWLHGHNRSAEGDLHEDPERARVDLTRIYWRGLLVAEPTMDELIEAVPEAIRELYAAGVLLEVCQRDAHTTSRT
jgi:hypothetical protein